MGFVCFILLEGKKHDARMLADSGLLNLLQSHAVSPFGQPMCIYGDPAYLLRLHLQTAFRNTVLTPDIQASQCLDECCTSFFGMAVWCYCKLFQIC